MKEAYPCSKAELIAENMFNFFRLFAIETVSTQDIYYMYSNIAHPFFNSVLKCNAQSSRIDDIIDTVHDYYQKKSISFSWIVTDLFEPKNLNEVLVTKNMKHQVGFKGLVCDLRSLAIQRKQDPKASSDPRKTNLQNLKIMPLKTDDELNNWIVPLQISFGFSDEVIDGMLRAFKVQFTHSKEKLEHFSVFFEDKRVGTGSLFYDKLSAGFYNLAVLPEYRNLGIASEIQKFRLNKSIEKGYRYATLQASSMADSLDRKLGFQDGNIGFNVYSSASLS